MTDPFLRNFLAKNEQKKIRPRDSKSPIQSDRLHAFSSKRSASPVPNQEFDPITNM